MVRWLQAMQTASDDRPFLEDSMNPLDDLEPRESTSEGARPRSPISRRLFLKGSGAAVASSAAAATVATAATIGVAIHASAQDATPMASPMAGMSGSSLAPGDTPVAFFSMHEAETVDAIVSRIMPGSADDPGAHEAGVVSYIDRQLGAPTLATISKPIPRDRSLSSLTNKRRSSNRVPGTSTSASRSAPISSPGMATSR